MNVHVITADWASHRDELRSIRAKVFIEEQNVPKEIEWDGRDEAAHHFLAINEAGIRVGCARLLPDGQIGRMAVLPDWRGGGIGRVLLNAAVEQATGLGLPRAFLHAQVDVVEFYRKSGFVPEGSEFVEAGIVHQSMSMPLPIPFEPPTDIKPPLVRPEAPPPEAEAAALVHSRGESECLESLIDTLGCASRVVKIYSQELDHTLFDQESVVAALSEFVRRGPPTRIRILIHSSSTIVSRGHRLLQLARRLDSKIELRCVPGEFADDRHACVVCDNKAYWLLPDYHEYQSLSNCYDPVQAAKLAERFDYLWDRSVHDPQLRTLRL